MFNKKKPGFKLVFVFVLAITAIIANVAPVAAAQSAGSGGGGAWEGTTPPPGFCDHGFYDAPAWHLLAGQAMPPKPCSNMGAFFMDLHDVRYGESRPKSYSWLSSKRGLDEATIRFDALQPMPNGFCNTPVPNNPGWHMPTGVHFSSAPCSSAGKWAMSLKNHVYRFSTYSALVHFWLTCRKTHGKEMTLYHEPSGGGCGC